MFFFQRSFAFQNRGMFGMTKQSLSAPIICREHQSQLERRGKPATSSTRTTMVSHSGYSWKLFDAKMNEELFKMNQKLDTINKSIQDQDRFYRVNYALEHKLYENGEFGYSWIEPKTQQGKEERYVTQAGYKKSADLVKNILLCFRKGHSYALPRGVVGDWSRTSSKQEAKEKEGEFQCRLVEQIFDVTGKKPRITQDDDEGNCSIWYS
jgi:hypothetical protein